MSASRAIAAKRDEVEPDMPYYGSWRLAAMRAHGGSQGGAPQSGEAKNQQGSRGLPRGGSTLKTGLSLGRGQRASASSAQWVRMVIPGTRTAFKPEIHRSW